MRLVAPFLLIATLLGACGDGTLPAPEGVSFNVVQARQDLQGRQFQVQVVNHGSDSLTVERAWFDSGRIDEPATYEGPAPVAAGSAVNLTMTMPRVECGTGIDATVRITYSVGGGETVTSEGRPTDKFGSIAGFMERDCAEAAVGDVTVDGLTVDDPTPDEGGEDATLEIGVTFTPPDSGDPVRLVSVGGSTLLAPAGTDATAIDRTLEPGGDPVHADLTFIPNRCDVHAVAEDRTGGILPLQVESEAFGSSRVYLRFDEEQKAVIFGYLAERCGFGEKQDPLNAP